jgi:erythromycin esterase
MRSTTLLALAVQSLCVTAISAGDAKPADIPPEARVAWLKQHVAPLRSIDPRDEDFADLEPMRQAIGDARVILLSEQTHGDGATFHARTRLIKFLHQKCGFDLLAFESGLYDCHKAWELLREGKMQAREAVSQGVFGIWTGTEEVQPMIQYLGQQARKARPLEICGFDCQFSGPASRRFLTADLIALFGKLPKDALSAEQRAGAIESCKQLATATGTTKLPDDAALIACQKALDRAVPGAALSAAELAYWRQVIDSTLVYAEVIRAIQTGVKTERNHINLRDTQMAKNLVWLAREAYPKRKILVWAHAFHLLRNQETVAMVVEPGKTPAERKTVYPYPGIRTMGNEAWKELKKETYSIFFTAAEGENQSLPMAKPDRLAPLVPGSIEDLLVKAGAENGFLDLRRRGQDGRWLEERLIARALGDKDHEADWTKICDGLVFTRKAYGVTPVKVDMAGARYQPKPDNAALGVPFSRFMTKDGFDRTITFYLSDAPKGATEPLPLALFIPGSGCDSVFSQRDGKVYGGLQNLLLAACKGRCRVLVVEKPGVAFGTVSQRPGSAEGSSEEFRREHTLPRWVEAVNAALRAAQQLDGIDWKRTLVVGHSEGGIVAAQLAKANPLATHLALLAGGGPTQLFDLVELAAQPDDRSSTDAAGRVQQVHDGWARVLAEPGSTDKLWLGHPHRRWSSFLKTSTLEGVLASSAPVFAAHGTLDRSVPVASFDVLCAELRARGRDLVALRLDGADHGFRKADDRPGSVKGLKDVLGRATAWFEGKRSPIEMAIQKDLERQQGKWDLVSVIQDGDNQPPLGVQLVVEGEKRTVRAGDKVYTQSRYRLDPSAQPPTIDITVTQGQQRGLTFLGIYEMSGDRMRMCLAAPGADRPRELVSRAGRHHTLQELKRVSP